MRIGIIGPSKVKDKEKIKEIAQIIAELGHEIIITADKGSSSELFALEYKNSNGKKVFHIVPLDDKEFGYDYLNLDLGKHINCGTWRNQPEKFNEETNVLVCIGYSVGVLAEIAYSKWFKPKRVYIIKELVSKELPKDSVRDLDLVYISFKDISKALK